MYVRETETTGLISEHSPFRDAKENRNGHVNLRSVYFLIFYSIFSRNLVITVKTEYTRTKI